MKLRLMLLAAIALSGGVSSLAHASDFTPTAENYRYGMALKVTKVLSINEQPDSNADMVQVEMLYLDHNDQVRCVTYLKPKTDDGQQN